MVYGLVGKSGSGKTTAAEVFAEYGFFVVDCDIVAAQMLNEDETIRAQLAEQFGRDVLTDGGIDRPLLASRAFSDRNSLDKLNSITHPPIVERLRELCEGREKVLLDAPTLFESGAYKLCDGIIALIASDALCEKRLLNRDGVSADTIRRRLSMQKSEKYLRENADIIIESCEDYEEFRRRIEDVAKTL